MKHGKPYEGPVNGCRTTKIYCLSGCPAGKRTRQENRVRFESREDARASGYRACKICRPDGPEAEAERFYKKSYETPIGAYVLVSSDRGIVGVTSVNGTASLLKWWARKNVRIAEGIGHNDTLARELDAYFEGKLFEFSVPLDLRGTDFQLQVWKQLQTIPYGETRSYGQIARAVGRPAAVRAVGAANGRNPVSIVVPCHRVIGADGRLVGYGGGLGRKKALLELEAGVMGRRGLTHRGYPDPEERFRLSLQ